MMADHEKGNSIAEKNGAAPIQIQGETVSKYDGLGSLRLRIGIIIIIMLIITIQTQICGGLSCPKGWEFMN